jgi:murein DD-endopeptidase MepM/ murein hydrolase activator NlpD
MGLIHLQATLPGWLDPVRKAPDYSLVKTVDQGQVFREVKGINPKIYTCLRHWYDGRQVFGGTFEENKERARIFFDTFIDGTFINEIAEHCDFVEEWNEYIASSDTPAETAERVTWARAAAEVWRDEYRTIPGLSHIRLVLCNAAIGNWIHRDFADVAHFYDCAMGYHPYTAWGWDNKPKVRWGEDAPLDMGVLDTLDWVYLSGLWDSMELDWGIDLDWVFTEAGPFEGCTDGWRSPTCLDGDLDLYVASVRDWLRDVQTTPAYAEGRIKGFGIFTMDTPDDEQFASYQTGVYELDHLVDMLAVEWKPGQPVVPPDPEPGCRGTPRVQYNRVFNVIPQEATTERATEIFVEAWERAKETVGGSYDDAGIGDLNSKIAVLHDLQDSQKQVYEDWFAEHYEGTTVEFSDDAFEITHWPTQSQVITQYFGSNPENYTEFSLPGHDGVDIGAAYGDVIDAVAYGRVYRVHLMDRDGYHNYGNHVRIEHRNGYKTIYAHLSEVLADVEVDVYLSGGDAIGFAGNTGNVRPRPDEDHPLAGTHLHFGMKKPPGDPNWPYNLIDPWPFLSNFLGN